MSTNNTISPDDIRRLRERLKLTQAELAERLCLTRGAIEHWETGRHEATGPAVLILRQLEAQADQADLTGSKAVS